jgi:hypothetical protein
MPIPQGVTCTAGNQGRLPTDAPNAHIFAQILVERTYSVGTFIVGMEPPDPQRMILVVIGHAADFTRIVSIGSSLRDPPIQITGPNDDAVREALIAVHDELFRGWLPSDDEINDRLNNQ